MALKLVFSMHIESGTRLNALDLRSLLDAAAPDFFSVATYHRCHLKSLGDNAGRLRATISVSPSNTAPRLEEPPAGGDPAISQVAGSR